MRSIYGVLITMALIVATPASGHHSAAMFDRTSTVALEGTVSRIDWASPHVYIYVETRDSSGQLVEWAIEGESTPVMTRAGWTPTTLTPGAPVTVQVNPASDPQSNHALLVSLLKEDGVSLTPRAIGRASNVPATGLAGVWNPLRSLIVGYLAFMSAYFLRALGILVATAGLVYLAGRYARFLCLVPSEN